MTPVDLAKAALRRLSSMEAFEISRMIDKDRDKELLARIHFARETLALLEAEGAAAVRGLATEPQDVWRADKVMSPKEYTQFPPRGWHGVRWDEDGCGNAGVKFLPPSPALADDQEDHSVVARPSALASRNQQPASDLEKP